MDRPKKVCDWCGQEVEGPLTQYGFRKGHDVCGRKFIADAGVLDEIKKPYLKPIENPTQTPTETLEP